MVTQRKRPAKALSKHGVTLCEYQAMICPYYEIYAEPEEMASWTLSENSEGGNSDQPLFSKNEYLEAIRQMIDKGWLMIHSHHARAATTSQEDRAPRREGKIVPAPETVGFTRKGYLLHRRIMRDVYGKRFMQKVDSFYTVNKSEREVHFYGQTPEVCHAWIHRAQQVYYPIDRISDIVGGPAEIVDVRGPTKIGQWRPSRFLMLARGFHVVVAYKRLKRRPLKVPDVAITGWVELLRPVRLVGHIHSDVFEFTDDASWTDISYDDQFAIFTWHFEVRGREGGILHQSEETPPCNRRMPLSIKQALEMLRRCAVRFLGTKGAAPTSRVDGTQ